MEDQEKYDPLVKLAWACITPLIAALFQGVQNMMG